MEPATRCPAPTGPAHEAPSAAHPDPVARRLTLAHLIACLALWTGLSTAAVVAFALYGAKPNARAVVLMGASLLVVWVGLGGGLALLLRERVRDRINAIAAPWQVRFVVMATLLALAEEAVTTTLTNMAPLFGVPMGSAYITASANYLDVVCLHSVVVFVPMFVCWAWMLSRWRFHRNAVLVLFGLTGTLAEMSLGGPQALAMVGFWTFVYGLMVYLPACCVPEGRGAAAPRWWHYPMAVLVPFLFVVPVAGLVHVLHPVKVHFAPIRPGT